MSDYHVEPVASSDITSTNQKTDNGLVPNNCRIRVVGVGGGGGNALQHMINQSLQGVEFIAVNTDSQALSKSTADLKIQIGAKLTNGLGAGCDPNKGRRAAEESMDIIKECLKNTDLVFITAGMGGGTGTGATPVIAEIAKEATINKEKDDKALIVAVVTKPFKFEGKRHMVNAEAGITELSKHVDSLIVIDNDKLLKNLGANVSIINAFNEANDVLLNAVKGITNAITLPAYINVDFNDVKAIMRGKGHAMIGTGMGQGANFVEDAVQRAIHSPLIEQVDIKSASGLLVHTIVNPNFPINKWEEINTEVQSYADENADCKVGLYFDESFSEDQIAVTVLITGISASDAPNAESPAAVARAKASIRRNEAISNAHQAQGGFFKFSQQGGTSMRDNFIQNNDGRQYGLGESIAPTQVFDGVNKVTDPMELPMGRDSMGAPDTNELWEVPPILRNKAD